MGDKMRREVDINVAHRHHLTGTLKATLRLYIGKRSIPARSISRLANASTKAS